MLKVLRRRNWICARCLRKVQQFQAVRKQSTAAAPISNSGHDYSANHPPEALSHSHDDTILRKVFDSQRFWRDFSRNPSTLGLKAGLIGNRYLTTPRGFQNFAEDALRKCKAIVEKTLTASTVAEYTSVARDLDRLSDLLCRVIDLSDFMRGTHPDPSYAKAATEAFSLMFQYMNELNTTTGLNQQLKKALSMPEVTSRWTDEEKAVAQILMKDFAKSGIDLPSKQREEFVTLSNEISQAGTDFVNGIEYANEHIALSSSQLNGVDPTLIQRLTSWNKAVVPLYSPVARVLMSTAYDEEARRAVYIAERTASKRSISRLQKLLLKRAQLSKLTGYTSFAQMTLVDKMAKTPEAVNNFLRSLNARNRGQVQQELSRLLTGKQTSDLDKISLKPWDHAYYLNRLIQSQSDVHLRTSRSRLHDNLPSFFSLGNVITGLSRLFHRLYGIRFVAGSALPGECWDPSVRRLDVVTETQEHIGVIYCDLFARSGKPPNPAHFTLVCSREISDDEIREADATGQHPNDGMPVGISVSPDASRLRRHQLPTIALVCDFPEPPSHDAVEPTLLSLHSVTTLFHEMGHAIHSILGRTSMQGISGTRCATDFAELPSVLMEYFATNPDVLRLFAKHWQSDAQIPDEMIDALKKEQKVRTERTGAWDDENQILMALLDQAFHSQDALAAFENGRFDSTEIYHRIWNEHGSVQEPLGTAWQGFFGHLYGYGATYYSYLFDRAIALQVWRSVFNNGQNAGAVDRNAGERLKSEVLKWGGGRDPWICLENLMGEGKGVLEEGGERAMLEVGRWGVGAGSEVGM